MLTKKQALDIIAYNDNTKPSIAANLNICNAVDEAKHKTDVEILTAIEAAYNERKQTFPDSITPKKTDPPKRKKSPDFIPSDELEHAKIQQEALKRINVPRIISNNFNDHNGSTTRQSILTDIDNAINEEAKQSVAYAKHYEPEGPHRYHESTMDRLTTHMQEGKHNDVAATLTKGKGKWKVEGTLNMSK